MVIPGTINCIIYILEIPNTWILTEIDTLYSHGLNILICPTKKIDERLLRGKKYHCIRSKVPDVWLEILRIICCHPFFCIKYFFKARKHIGVRYFLRTLFFLAVIKKQNVTHIHAHFGAGGTHMAMVISELTGIPFSFTTHAFDIFRNDTDYSLLHRKIEKAQWVRCTYQYNKDFFLKLYNNVPQNKYHIIHLAVDIKKYASVTKRTHENFNILSVSNLVEKKGIEFMVKACRILKDRGYKFIYTMIGDGPERERLDAMVNSFGLKDTIIMKGNLPNHDLIKHFEITDVFALPCIVAHNGDMDGIPTALMEAMVAGIPTISTRVSGIPELIQDKETGLLVNEKNEFELAEAIEKIMKDPLLAERLAKQGREKVRRDFNIEYTAKDITVLFQNA